MERLRQDSLSRRNKIGRAFWAMTYILLFRISPRSFFGWRRFLLRCWGAQVESGVLVYPSARIWAPWNLVMMEGSCLGDYVDCYNVTTVTLEEHSVASQYSFLCTASHDFDQVAHPLVTAEIRLQAYSWVTADVFVGPGVTVGAGAVVLARSTVLKDVEAWKVCGGSPLRILRDRKLSRDHLEKHFTVN